MHPFSKSKLFSYGKLEFTIVTGVSFIIIVSTATILFSFVHMIFFHTFYPPALIAAWIAAALGVANWYFEIKLKEEVPVVKEADTGRIKFLLNMDLVLSVLVILTVVISRMGFMEIDYILAISESIFIIIYGIFFLYNSLKGLMDASCDKETAANVKNIICKADSKIKLQKLKINPISSMLEIMAVIGVPKSTNVADVNNVIRKIKLALNVELKVQHEVYVGISTNESGGG